MVTLPWWYLPLLAGAAAGLGATLKDIVWNLFYERSYRERLLSAYTDELLPKMTEVAMGIGQEALEKYRDRVVEIVSTHNAEVQAAVEEARAGVQSIKELAGKMASDEVKRLMNVAMATSGSIRFVLAKAFEEDGRVVSEERVSEIVEQIMLQVFERLIVLQSADGFLKASELGRAGDSGGSDAKA